jgi:peptide deformylase
MIITYPNPILLKKCEPVLADEDVSDLISKLKIELYKENAAGIAANQIGISKTIFLAIIPQLAQPLIFINPEIKYKSSAKSSYKEGCLSFPDLFINIARPSEVKIDYEDENRDKKINVKFEGILARIILHEYDHLNGIVFTTRSIKHRKYGK